MSDENSLGQTNSKGLDSSREINPTTLDTIGQVEYALTFLGKGKTAKELAEKFDNEYSYVHHLIDLFERIGWIEKLDSKWLLTDSGRHDIEYLRRAKS